MLDDVMKEKPFARRPIRQRPDMFFEHHGTRKSRHLELRIQKIVAQSRHNQPARILPRFFERADDNSNFRRSFARFVPLKNLPRRNNPLTTFQL